MLPLGEVSKESSEMDHASDHKQKGSSAMSRAPSGAQFHISAGSQRATIVEVGGGIREYVVDGRDVLDPYPLGAMCDGAHGAPLVPWPNRLADGAYSFDGNRYQLAINEPDKHNAIHGLLRWRNWQAIEHEPDRVLMATRLHPLTGYPFLLDVQIEYALSSAGLSVTTTATNEGEMACPYASGQHPYLSPGTGLIDTCTLQLEAASWVDTANDRQLPTGTRATAGTPLDFSVATALGEQKLDTPFFDLARDSDQRAWVILTANDGTRAELWVDSAYEFIELYTGDTLDANRQRRGLGAEPMTCPPNAFQTGTGVQRLEPGRGFTSTWGARLG
jgi:aldose 1-epimerase